VCHVGQHVFLGSYVGLHHPRFSTLGGLKLLLSSELEAISKTGEGGGKVLPQRTPVAPSRLGKQTPNPSYAPACSGSFLRCCRDAAPSRPGRRL
jgi:hypothetical protein